MNDESPRPYRRSAEPEPAPGKIRAAPRDASRGAASTHTSTPAPPTPHPAGPLVLVVEDNPVNMRLMRLTLTTRGYAVQGAKDGEEALAWLEGHRPEVILLDMQLPGMDGFSLAARIKGRVEMESIPIVAVTSYAMAGDQERALAAGCDAYIAKPIDDTLLLAALAAATGRRDAGAR
jgi:two-component system, cell cycle response regulator DivK